MRVRQQIPVCSPGSSRAGEALLVESTSHLWISSRFPRHRDPGLCREEPPSPAQGLHPSLWAPKAAVGVVHPTVGHGCGSQWDPQFCRSGVPGQSSQHPFYQPGTAGTAFPRSLGWSGWDLLPFPRVGSAGLLCSQPGVENLHPETKLHKGCRLLMPSPCFSLDYVVMETDTCIFSSRYPREQSAVFGEEQRLPLSRQHHEQSLATGSGGCEKSPIPHSLRLSGQVRAVTGTEMLSQFPISSSDARGVQHKGRRVWRWGGEQQRWFPGETAP